MDLKTRSGWEQAVKLASDIGWEEAEEGITKLQTGNELIKGMKRTRALTNLLSGHILELRRVYKASYWASVQANGTNHRKVN